MTDTFTTTITSEKSRATIIAAAKAEAAAYFQLPPEDIDVISLAATAEEGSRSYDATVVLQPKVPAEDRWMQPR